MIIKVRHKALDLELTVELDTESPDALAEVTLEGRPNLQRLFLETCKGVPGAYGHTINLTRCTPRDFVAVVAQLRGWDYSAPSLPPYDLPRGYKS